MENSLLEDFRNGVRQEDPATAAAFDIMEDVFDRSVLRQALDECDDDIQEEILKTWVGIIRGHR